MNQAGNIKKPSSMNENLDSNPPVANKNENPRFIWKFNTAEVNEQLQTLGVAQAIEEPLKVTNLIRRAEEKTTEELDYFQRQMKKREEDWKKTADDVLAAAITEFNRRRREIDEEIPFKEISSKRNWTKLMFVENLKFMKKKL
jgi:hypothetical protein